MKIDFEGFEDLEASLSGVGINITSTAKKAVNACAPIVKDALVGAINSSTHGTGQLAGSIAFQPAKENEWGVYSTIGATGSDSNGTPNDLKLKVLEYGRRGGYNNKNGRYVSTEEPRGVMTKAVKAVEDEVARKMEEIVQKEIEDRLS